MHIWYESYFKFETINLEFMRTHILNGIFALLALFSCTTSEEIITIPTIVKGHVYDVERGIDIENFKLVLVWSSINSGGDLAGVQIEEIDSARTDIGGRYSISFNYIPGKRYGFLKQYYGDPYHTEFQADYSILEGKTNVVDVNAWQPMTLKLNLQVTNNDNPELGIANEVSSGPFYNFIGARIHEQAVDTTVYLTTKPNADIELQFYYSTGTSNADVHKRFEYLRTTVADTLELSYEIDCSLF